MGLLWIRHIENNLLNKKYRVLKKIKKENKPGMSGSIIGLMCICIVNNPDANDWLPSFLFYNETKTTGGLRVIYGPSLSFSM